jgi:hypothetical protein
MEQPIYREDGVSVVDPHYFKPDFSNILSVKKKVIFQENRFL